MIRGRRDRGSSPLSRTWALPVQPSRLARHTPTRLLLGQRDGTAVQHNRHAGTTNRASCAGQSASLPNPIAPRSGGAIAGTHPTPTPTINLPQRRPAGVVVTAHMMPPTINSTLFNSSVLLGSAGKGVTESARRGTRHGLYSRTSNDPSKELPGVVDQGRDGKLGGLDGGYGLLRRIILPRETRHPTDLDTQTIGAPSGRRMT